MEKHIDFRERVTSLAFNGISKGIVPKGIYSGGAVTPGPGLSVRIEPFIAKSFDGLSLNETNWTTVNIGAVGTWFIVLRVAFDGLAPASTSWLVLTPSQFTSNADRYLYICFGHVVIPGGATVVTSDMIGNLYADVIRLDPVYRGHFFNGSDNFNGMTGTTIAHGLGHTNYYVHVTPSEPSGLAIGEVYVAKDPSTFTVFNTGAAVTKFDYILIPERSFFPQALTGAKTGKFIFNGTSGITIGHYFGSADYAVVVYPLTDQPTGVGDIWVEKTSDTFTIKNNGVTGMVGVWMMFPTTATSLFTRGTAAFAGVGGQVITHAIGHTNYFVHVIPVQDPTVAIGDIHVYKEATQFTVYNQGAAITNFEYVLFLDTSPFCFKPALNFGSTTGVRTNHLMNTLEYVPIITPVQYVDPISEIGFIRGFNFFDVYNMGIATSQFDALLISIYSWM